MRAAFSYYIHRPSTATAFPIGRVRLSRLGFSLVEGRPAAQGSIVPLAVIRGLLTFVQAHRGLGSSRSACSATGGPPVPCRRWQSVLAQTRRRSPEGPALAFRWPPFFPPRHARRHFRGVLEGLAGAPRGPGPGEQGAGGVGEAAAMQAHRWQGKSRCGMAAWPGRWLPRGRGLLASAG